jgi:hypothetical protein
MDCPGFFFMSVNDGYETFIRCCYQVTQRNPQGILLGCAYRAPDTKPDHVMLAKLSAEVRECLWHAEDCAKRAETEPNPAIQRDYIEMEKRWLKLARSYQLFERIQTFSAHQEQQRGELSDRLEQLQALAQDRR